MDLITARRSTIVFGANNRRVVGAASRKRIFNERVGGRGRTPAIDPDFPYVHHGSLHADERRATEAALKNGELPAVVATASLELGIDMGAVDLVCQVESPGSVSRGLHPR